jgi:hypothetical protein
MQSAAAMEVIAATRSMTRIWLSESMPWQVLTGYRSGM